MSHLLDLEGVVEKLVLLQHFAHGSEQYCRERLIESKYDVGSGALDEYWGWVKSLVSAYTLECSIRFRVLLDAVVGKSEADKIVGLAVCRRESSDSFPIAQKAFVLTVQ